MTVGFGNLVMKAKRPVGKRGDPGRFVTLKTGRVIFIPKGYKSKWADVREQVLAGKRKRGLLSGLVPENNLKDLTLGPGGGLYGATTAEGTVDAFAYHPGTGKLLAGGPWDFAMHDALIEKYGEGRHYDEFVKAHWTELDQELHVWHERFTARSEAERFNGIMSTAKAVSAAGFPDDATLVIPGTPTRPREIRMPLGDVVR